MTIRNYQKRKRTEASLRRILVYSACFFILAVAETSFFGSLELLPATPDLMLGLVVCVLLFDSAQAASAVAIGAGTLIDALGAGSFFLSPLFYFALCLLLFHPASKMLPRFLSFCVLLLPCLALRALFTALCLTLYVGGLPSLDLFLSTLLPELLMTALLCLPIYPIVKLCRRILSPRRAFHVSL